MGKKPWFSTEMDAKHSNDRDRTYMRQALSLAKGQYGKTGNNPAVGCVIVAPSGEVVGKGATADGGRPHAEAIALDMAGRRAFGATAYVTLEPCAARSAGGMACSTRLIAAGIARLVASTADEHPLGAGGFARLREAGIDVEVGLMADMATVLYADFFARAGKAN